MKPITACICVILLASCGGGVRQARDSAPTVRLSSGPIASACARSDRSAANARLCGCIQTAANQSLSAADQRRAAPFFTDPALAQEVRKSDSNRNDAFWERYTTFAERAEGLCQGL